MRVIKQKNEPCRTVPLDLNRNEAMEVGLIIIFVWMDVWMYVRMYGNGHTEQGALLLGIRTQNGLYYYHYCAISGGICIITAPSGY